MPRTSRPTTTVVVAKCVLLALSTLPMAVVTTARAEPIEGVLQKRSTVLVPLEMRAPFNGQLGPLGRELNQRGKNVAIPVLRPELEEKATQAPKLPAGKKAPQIIEPKPMGSDHTATACFIALEKIAAVKLASQPKAADAACVIPNPVLLLQSKGKDTIQFSQGLTLDCTIALRLVTFLKETAQPLAEYHLGSPISNLGSGEGYVCRRRNNAATGKLSEHAFGNAIDIVSFKLANAGIVNVQVGSKMEVPEKRFLKAFRNAACGHFTTVLGPGSNPAHATHIHLDLAREKDRKNPYRICE